METETKIEWSPDAEAELSGVPSFIVAWARGVAEETARERGESVVTADTVRAAFDSIATMNTQVAVAAWEDLARQMRSMPSDALGDPTGCSEWTIRDLSVHVADRALFYSGKVREGAQGEAPPPDTREDELKDKSMDELADITAQSAREFGTIMKGVRGAALNVPVQMPFGRVPVGRVPGACATETAVHHWDMRARRESNPTIPEEWGNPIALTIHHSVPALANRAVLADASGTYLFLVGSDDVPVSIIIKDGTIEAVEDVVGTPDVTLHLTPDQYIRIIWGRLDIRQEAEAGTLKVDGDIDRAAQLNRVFPGA